jgi:ABC-2 type transport system ATP-binding protein
VTLQSIAPRVAIDLPGLTVLPSQPHATVLDVDTRLVRVEQVIAQALAQGGIEDITIEDPPMEEVVREIYLATAGD